jgi:hypothetical protein
MQLIDMQALRAGQKVCSFRGRVLDLTSCGCTAYHCQVHGTCSDSARTGLRLCCVCPDKITTALVTMPPVPDEILTSTQSQLLIITVGVGDKAAELLTITRPAMERYAQRVGADFVSIRGESWCPQFPMMDKFRIYPYAQQYEQMLFVDADAFIRKDCPNLFEWYPNEVIGMHDDTPYNDSWDWRGEARSVALSQREPFDRDKFRLYNSGVVLSSRKHASIWKPPSYPIPHHWCSEQHLVTIRAINQQYPIAPFPRAFNWQWWANRFCPCTDNSRMHIVHAAGFGNNLGGTHEGRVKWLRDRKFEDDNDLPSLSHGDI